MHHLRRLPAAGVRIACLAAVTAAVCAAGVAPATAGDDSAAAVPARQDLDLVRDAAHAWQPDAVLVYLENDENLDAGGRSSRWGYLFRSASGNAARAYSVRNGRIVAAGNASFDLEAPPLPAQWIDSDAALAAAEKKAGDYRKDFGGRPTTLLLMRGGFDEKKPDLTTWTVIYTADGAPSFYVVVDAANGKVKRSWRG